VRRVTEATPKQKRGRPTFPKESGPPSTLVTRSRRIYFSVLLLSATAIGLRYGLESSGFHPQMACIPSGSPARAL
jgi:hypothetical protein